MKPGCGAMHAVAMKDGWPFELARLRCRRVEIERAQHDVVGGEFGRARGRTVGGAGDHRVGRGMYTECLHAPIVVDDPSPSCPGPRCSVRRWRRPSQAGRAHRPLVPCRRAYGVEAGGHDIDGQQLRDYVRRRVARAIQRRVAEAATMSVY
jgi:hypothetical protein